MAERVAQVSTPRVTDAFGTREREITIAAAPLNPRPTTFLEFSGHRLTSGVLIGLFIVIGIFLWILSSEPTCAGCGSQLPMADAKRVLADCVNSKLTGDDYLKACPAGKLELAKLVLSDPNVAAYREFWKAMFERIVGTTLLPIVTALLGYLFASNAHGVQPRHDSATGNK